MSRAYGSAPCMMHDRSSIIDHPPAITRSSCVLRSLSITFTSAHPSSKHFATSTVPAPGVHVRVASNDPFNSRGVPVGRCENAGESSGLPSRESTLAPCPSSRAPTRSCSPLLDVMHVMCNGVEPLSSFEFTFAPCSNNSWMTSRFYCSMPQTVEESGVTSLRSHQDYSQVRVDKNGWIKGYCTYLAIEKVLHRVLYPRRTEMDVKKKKKKKRVDKVGVPAL